MANLTISTNSNNKEEYKRQAQILANYLPQGKAWDAKNIEESNLRKLLNAFGKEFVNVDESLKWLKRELNIRTTFDLLPAWEEAYGIPDNEDIFTIENKTIEERRFNLLFKELMNGADRPEDWEYLASLLGHKIKVYPASKTNRFPYTFPIRFFDNSKYVIQIDVFDALKPAIFPLAFPFIFGNNKLAWFQKVVNIIKPANCSVHFSYPDKKEEENNIDVENPPIEEEQ